MKEEGEEGEGGGGGRKKISTNVARGLKQRTQIKWVLLSYRFGVKKKRATRKKKRKKENLTSLKKNVISEF